MPLIWELDLIPATSTVNLSRTLHNPNMEEEHHQTQNSLINSGNSADIKKTIDMKGTVQRSSKLRMCYDISMSIVLFGAIIGGAFYITHLHQRITELEKAAFSREGHVGGQSDTNEVCF